MRGMVGSKGPRGTNRIAQVTVDVAMGGRAPAENLSPDQRRELTRKAARARWVKK